jgi:hypothetical protein
MDVTSEEVSLWQVYKTKDFFSIFNRVRITIHTTMVSNPKKLVRFFSEQCHKNCGYIQEENETKKISLKQHFRGPIDNVQQSRKNFLRQRSSPAEQKIDNLEKETQHVSEILQRPT